MMRYLTGRGPTQALIVTTAVSLATIVVFGLYAARPAQAAIVTLVGAGDIAGCKYNADEATAKLLEPRGVATTVGAFPITYSVVQWYWTSG
jgi:hypothetical protein